MSVHRNSRIYLAANMSRTNSILVALFLGHHAIQPTSAADQYLDWVLAVEGESCHDACFAVGGECELDGINQIVNRERMLFVDTILGGQCEYAFANRFGNEPSYYDLAKDCGYLWGGESGSCDSIVSNERKYCCCGSHCPVEPLSDWKLGETGQSCSEVCGGNNCNEGGTSGIDSPMKAAFVASLPELHLACDAYEEGTLRNEPSFYTTSRGLNQCTYLRDGEIASCDASFRSEQRLCCCGDSCQTSG